MGLVKAMFVSGIFMASTNILFSVLAWVGSSEILFAFTVLIDDLSAAFATVAFVGFISALVDRTYTATQYALTCIRLVLLVEHFLHLHLV